MGDFLYELYQYIINNLTATVDTKWLMFSGAETGAILSLINKVWHYFMIVAIGMTLIYFLIEINQKFALEGRDMTLKSFFVPFLKLMIAIAVISQGAKIISFVLGLNNTFIDFAKGAFPDTSSAIPEDPQVKEVLISTTFIKALVIVLPMLLTLVITWILGVVWWYKAITYKLELLYRVAISPIALADVYSGGHSNAIKWVKGLLGLGVYAMAFIIIPRIATLLVTGNAIEVAQEISDGNALNPIHPIASGLTVIDIVKTLAYSLVVPFASLGVLGAVKSASKEVFG